MGSILSFIGTILFRKEVKMENFIKKIFDIDTMTENYQKELDFKKQNLLNDRKERLHEIDLEYLNILKNEKENFEFCVEKFQKEQKDRLIDFNKKSTEIKDFFNNKKVILVKKFANDILESGEFYDE